MINTFKMSKISKKVREIYNNRCRISALILVFLSLICFLTMLIGSAIGSVDLNKFTFDANISKIIQRKSIKFTLLGYCIDNKCTKHVSHNFDKGKFYLSCNCILIQRFFLKKILISTNFLWNPIWRCTKTLNQYCYKWSHL